MTTNNWSHFKDNELFRKLVSQQQNVFLYGPPNSGKTTLVNEILFSQFQFHKGKTKVIRVNCLMASNMKKLKNQLIKKLLSILDEKCRKKYHSFQQLVKALN